MNLSLISPGKTREPFLRDGFDKYAKLINRYHPFDAVWVKPEPLKEGRNEAQVRAAESERMLKAMEKQPGYKVLLDVSGKRLPSEKLASLLQTKMDGGTGRMWFIIGGPVGVDGKLRQTADMRLSVSDMTFTHELARVLLGEQIYRACTILRGEKYHK